LGRKRQAAEFATQRLRLLLLIKDSNKQRQRITAKSEVKNKHDEMESKHLRMLKGHRLITDHTAGEKVQGRERQCVSFENTYSAEGELNLCRKYVLLHVLPRETSYDSPSIWRNGGSKTHLREGNVTVRNWCRVKSFVPVEHD
jgi:hypothetical protein